MFFTRYNPMTPDEIDRQTAGHPRADGQGSDALAGWMFEARLEGPYAPENLSYEILDAGRLQFRENGVLYDAPYAAAETAGLVLLTHLVPGTSRGWHLALDVRTRALAAFETWFGIEVPIGGDRTGTRPPTGMRSIPREIQRQIHFGWADRGDGVRPEQIPTTTNRLEGRGLHWRQDDGYEQLTFFPSVVCSTFVELSDPRGGITMANPSDYLRFDDTHYVYARWDVEFSGGMRIEALDLYGMRAAGVAFGFDESDALVYALHTAGIEVTGDAAHLESIADWGGKAPPMASLRGKGARYAYRPMDFDTPMTHEEALRYAAEAQHILEKDGLNVMDSRNALPFSGYLAGRRFRVRLDGEKHAAAPWGGTGEPVYEYDVAGPDRLRWRHPGGEWREEKYIAFEVARDLILFSHMLTGDPDYANLTQAVDFSNGLATTVRAQIGNWHSGWEAGGHARFGVLECDGITPPFARRHHFTTDLVGKSYAWAYSETMSSIHVYSSPESFSWTIFQADNSGGATWSSPCFYIKLRDDAYLFQWGEENCNGTQGLVVFNPNLMQDSGFSYGVNHDRLSLHVTGAYARKLGQFDILKHYGRTSSL
ncbi:MAG: hypothetical protein KBA30_03230 [Clostridia bacterium]|nr:hypothetical protein [Clostridia bacterium]